HGARLRVEHDRRRALRAPLRHGLAQHLLGVRLDRVVEREEDGLARASRRDPVDLDRTPERVADDDLLAVPAAEARFERELEAGEPLVVDTGVAEHLRCDRVLRVASLLLAVEAEAGELVLPKRCRLRWIRFALPV